MDQLIKELLLKHNYTLSVDHSDERVEIHSKVNPVTLENIGDLDANFESYTKGESTVILNHSIRAILVFDRPGAKKDKEFLKELLMKIDGSSYRCFYDNADKYTFKVVMGDPIDMGIRSFHYSTDI